VSQQEQGPPAGYVECLRKMIDGATRWLSVFPDVVTLRLAPKEIMYVGNLDERGVRLLAGDDVSARFLRAVDEASGHEATIFLVHCMAEFLPVERVRRVPLPIGAVQS